MNASKGSKLGLLVLGLALVLGTGAPAQPPARAGVQEDIGLRKVAFEMKGKPWKDVFDWLVKESGIPFYGPNLPTGTFTYIGPTGLGDKKSISEVIDILNTALRPQKVIIVRHLQALTLVGADEVLPPIDVPRLTSLDELKNHGNTEIVSLTFPLKVLNADEFAPQVKKMMTAFGVVHAFTQTNTLYMQDDVASLKQIVGMIKEGENLETRPGDNLSYKCLYIPARDAEKTLKSYFGDPAKSPMESPTNPMAMMQGMQMPGMPTFVMQDPNMGRRGGRGPGGRGGAPAAETGIKSVVRAITSDEQTNTVFVSGPADKLAQAKAILQKIDTGTEKFITGPAFMKTYAVASGDAEQVAAMMTQNFKDSTVIKIAAVGNSAILVYAFPADHFRIAKDLQTAKPTGGAVKIQLNNLDANSVVDTLKNMYNSTDGKSGPPYLQAEVSENAIIVRGSDEQIEDVRGIIKALGDQVAFTPGMGNLRIITLEKGNAAALAEALQKAMSELRQNPVKVLDPNAKPQSPPKDQIKPIKDGGEEEDDPKAQSQLFDPQKKTDNKPGDKQSPITITALGNKIIINSDDPKAIALAQELIRIYTQAPKGDTGFEIIKLKNAKATDAAKILDDAFNGPKQPQAGIPGLNFGGGGRGGANFFQQMMQQQAAQSTAKPRIRVVADPATNSLLVQASPLDMLEIRHLLDKAIDSNDTDSNAVIKTWKPIVLKNANASEVAATVSSVYREYMDAGASASFTNVGPNGISFATRNRRGNAVDANGNPRSVSLTIGLYANTNSIVLQCSETMYKEVKLLIDELDQAAKDSPSTVKLVRIRDVDPYLVQQALDAIQGRPVTSASGIPVSGGQGSGMGGPGAGANGGRGGAGFTGGGQPGGGGGAFGGGGGNPFGGGGRGGFGGGGNAFGGGGGGFGGGRGGAGGGGGGRGGAGGGGRGGLQRSPGTAPDGGPDFFEHGVKEDPQSLSLLYDPRQDNSPVSADMIRALAVGRAPEQLNEELMAVAAYEQQPPIQPALGTTTSQDVPAPKAAISAEVLPDAGFIVIRGPKADVEAIEKIIQIIVGSVKGTEISYQLIPLKYADATSVTATLNQVFSRVSVTVTGGSRILQGSTQTNISTPGGNISAGTNVPAQNLVLIPLFRFNAIFVAAPEVRMAEIKSQIQRLDHPTSDVSRAVPFGLKRASAQTVATMINNFYTTRGESQNSNQIRITYDTTSNSVIVQAAPADMEDIRRLIEHLDNTPTSAINELRIYRLKVALADELTNLLVSSIAQGVLATGTTAPTGGALGAPGGIAGGAGGGFAGGPGGAAAAPRPTGGVAGGGTSVIAGSGGTPQTKNVGIRFIGRSGAVDGLVLEDIHLTPDLRTNSILISAPARTMPMLLDLIDNLDVVPTARAEIKIFPLKRLDATALQTMLQNIFFGTTTNVPGSGQVTNSNAGSTTTGGAGAATPAGGGGGGAGAGLTGSGALGQSGPVPRSIIEIAGQPAEGAPLVELHITADPVTNSLIVAGGRSELIVIEAIILRLENAPIAERNNEVVHLRNASAADVATALQNFIVSSLRINVTSGQNNAYQEMEKDIIVIAEPFTNSLLISATPKYFAKLQQLIERLDARPPQVVIQVMIAEVDLDSTEEFGMEIGLQSPVLFNRSVWPNTTSGFGSNTMINYANTSTDSVVGTATGTLNPFANPGFNFNASPNLPALGTNPLQQPSVVGVQGVGNYGLGRADSNGLSGFVFSAASNSFNLLIRALKTQGRVDILSRPQIMTLDNQTATINIGQQIPYVSGTTLTSTGLSQQSIDRVIVGVNLQVTPRISPEDGSVLMRVTPSVSSPVPTQINLGNGILATAFNVQQVDTTVQAQDGETVCIGGLITKNEQKTENKIPVVGDLPFLGALFRYRTQTRMKTELIVIMTPHIVYGKADIERVLGEEARRMDWIMSDVLRTHGTYGMEPIIPKKDPGAGTPGAGGPGSQLPGPNGEIEGPTPVPVPQGAPSNAAPGRPMSQQPGQPQAYMTNPQSIQAVTTAPYGVNTGGTNAGQQQAATSPAPYGVYTGGTTAGYTQGGADNYGGNNPGTAPAPQDYSGQGQVQAAPAKSSGMLNWFSRNQ